MSPISKALAGWRKTDANAPVESNGMTALVPSGQCSARELDVRAFGRIPQVDTQQLPAPVGRMAGLASMNETHGTARAADVHRTSSHLRPLRSLVTQLAKAPAILSGTDAHLAAEVVTQVCGAAQTAFRRDDLHGQLARFQQFAGPVDTGHR